MKRHLALLDYALGSLRRRARRNLAIVFGLAVVVGAFAAVLFLTDALRAEFARSVDVTPDLTVQRVVAGRPALIENSAAEGLRTLPGVRSARPRIWGYLFIPSLEANVTIVGRHEGELGAALATGVVAGRDIDEAVPGEAIVGQALAGRLGLRLGDGLAVPQGEEIRVLEVAGLFDADSAIHTADVIVVSEADAHALLGVPADQATDIAIDLTTPDEAGVVAEHAVDTLGSVRVLDKRLLRRTYELTFDARGGLLAAALVPALIALLLLAWERLTGLGEIERREIGVLKAIGWGISDVLTARMWESAIIAFFGAAIGLVGAYLFVFVAGAPGLSAALFGWSTLYPELDLVPAVDAAQLASLLGSVVVPFVAVSIVPAFSAAAIDPDRAMRGLK